MYPSPFSLSRFVPRPGPRARCVRVEIAEHELCACEVKARMRRRVKVVAGKNPVGLGRWRVKGRFSWAVANSQIEPRPIAIFHLFFQFFNCDNHDRVPTWIHSGTMSNIMIRSSRQLYYACTKSCCIFTQHNFSHRVIATCSCQPSHW